MIPSDKFGKALGSSANNEIFLLPVIHNGKNNKLQSIHISVGEAVQVRVGIHIVYIGNFRESDMVRYIASVYSL